MTISYLDRLTKILVDAPSLSKEECFFSLSSADKTRTSTIKHRTEAKKKKKKKPVPDKKDVLVKIRAIEAPTLLLINTNVTSTDQSDADIVKEAGRENYKKFRKDSDVRAILPSCVNLSSLDGIQCWLCPNSKLSDLTTAAFRFGLDHSTSSLPQDLFSVANPFAAIKIGLKGMEKVGKSKIKVGLSSAWEPFYTAVTEEKKQQEEIPEEKESPKEDTPDEKKEDDIDLTDLTTDEKETDEDIPLEEEPDVEVEDAPALNVGKYRSLKDPYIFILDPRKKRLDYLSFLGPDEEGTKQKKASNVLPKALKMYVARHPKLKAPEGEPVIVYFLSAKEAADIQTELKRESPPQYLLAPFDKVLFDKDEPFDGLVVNNVPVDETLVAELNKQWMEATSRGSGTPIPAVQASASIPLDYFRLLNKKQRHIQLHIGNRPEGSGTKNTIYILASEAEAEAFVKRMRSFKMPSLFYERFSANSDIDAGFKATEPRKLLPSNVLILKAAERFDPKAPALITEHNVDLLPQQDAGNASKLLKQLAQLPSGSEEKIEAIKTELTKYATQLDLLHSFAQKILGNKTKKTGAFIKSSTIGTHVAQFNANMTICFLWGSLTTHVTIDPKEVMRKLPFVKQVITGYL